MFRNPRENAEPLIATPVKPSVGRPPTPPNASATPHRPSSTMSTRSSTKPLTPRPNSKSNTPIIGRQGTKKIAASRTPAKSQNSILNFFKKVDAPVGDDSIFLSQGALGHAPQPQIRELSSDVVGEDDLYDVEDNPRFNEVSGPLKRRKSSDHDTQTRDLITVDGNDITDIKENFAGQDAHACTPPPPEDTEKPVMKKQRRKGPFLSDSESEDENNNEQIQERALRAQKSELISSVSHQPAEMNALVTTKPINQEQITGNRPTVPLVESVTTLKSLPRNQRTETACEPDQANPDIQQPDRDKDVVASPVIEMNGYALTRRQSIPVIPTMKKDETSLDEWSRFEDGEGFLDDEFTEGEEFVERKWMEEQARLEAAELAAEEGYDFDGVGEYNEAGEGMMEISATCPICNSSLDGISPDQATRHVNGCLDENPVPLPKMVKTESSEPSLMPPDAKNRFARKAAVARPGQANPFEHDSSGSGPSSAFSKLMSGHAEDAAWATAAAAEHSSRGKPAYQRTCPFYKIMPGFFICVDAFRYGAVQGCNAYFLSHFHSDHYVGLTSTWCHGPIYCSKVTGNLVKQQLRVDPKWVVSLDFEERFEVPGTQGVAVTMIPANHCPGSSLYLFEKVIRRGSSPKVQRVLHCGDFRACSAHVEHPLLMPDVVDTITGKSKQQKIDVCYLDTTYLNPRYAFPPQDEVIKACADMCVSLKKERAEESDAWESAKRERAGTGMAKFVSNIKIESSEDREKEANGENSSRGRLLVVCGTYSIGKERICMGIARALDCKIWAAPGKQRICAALEDEELSSRMTDDPREAQIHMQMLMEIRPETLKEYLEGYKPYFSRIVAFRPSGWNYRPPNSRFVESPQVSTVLHSDTWRSRYTLADLVPQRGSTREASCFGVPYSEHSSFRELTIFVCALRIEKVVPTVNVGSAAGRAKMKAWVEKWMAERRKAAGGVVKVGKADGEIRW